MYFLSLYLTSGQRNPCRKGRDLKAMGSADNQMHHWFLLVVIRAGSQTPGGLKSNMFSYSFSPDFVRERGGVGGGASDIEIIQTLPQL